MANGEPPEGPESWAGVGEQIAEGLASWYIKSDASKAVAAFVAEVAGKLIGALVTLTAPVGIGLAKGIANSEDLVAPALADIAATAVSDAFGINVPASAFASRRDPSGRRGAADALGAGFMRSVEGAGGAVEPSDEAAQRFLGMVMNMALEGWYQGWFFEFMTSMVPGIDVGKIESFAELDDTIMQALGLGRMTRRVVQPMLQAKVITPLQWHVNKQYRPELLSPTDAIRQHLRGRWTLEQMSEELARQGWSAERIEALVNAQRKFFSVADVRQFVTREHWDRDRGLQHLQDQGYTQPEAEDALRLEGLKRFESLEAEEARAIIAAYVAGDVTRAEMQTLMDRAVSNTTERNLFLELAELRQGLSRRFLTAADERRLVLKGIRSVVDFRRALEREGYVADAVTALELELRQEQEAQRDLAELKAEQAEQREADQQRTAEERAARLAAIAAEKALPSVAEVRRAYVRGHVPIDRYRVAVEAAHPGITGDDLAALLADAEQDRNAQLEALERRERAAQQEADAVLSLGTLESAVL
ncbi:MAG: hypothetical protein ACREUZ_06000, partial [Burkholderiales bacterium]